MDLASYDAVLITNAGRWRDGLQRLGKEAVLAKLRQRPGHPGDPLHDIVYEPPHPTREFCQQWYTEEDGAFRVNPTKAGLLVVLAIIAITGFVHALGNLGVTPTNHLVSRPAGLPQPAPLPQKGSNQPPFPTW